MAMAAPITTTDAQVLPTTTPHHATITMTGVHITTVAMDTAIVIIMVAAKVGVEGDWMMVKVVGDCTLLFRAQ